MDIQFLMRLPLVVLRLKVLKKYMNGEVLETAKPQEEEKEEETLFDMNTPLNDGEYQAEVNGQTRKDDC